MIYDPMVRTAEGIAEKVVMKYMGRESSQETLDLMRNEYSRELKRAGIPEGLVCIHLDAGNGSVYIHQPAPAYAGVGAGYAN